MDNAFVLFIILAGLAINIGLLVLTVRVVRDLYQNKRVGVLRIAGALFGVAIWGSGLIKVATEDRDTAKKPEPSPAAATTTAPSAPPSPWVLSETASAMMDKKTKFACTTSLNEAQLQWPYANTHAQLCLRRDPRAGLDAYVLLDGEGQILCDIPYCTLHVRFDQGAVQNFTADRSSDGSTNVIFFTRPARVLAALKTSKVTVVELTFYKAGNQQLTFWTEGMPW